MKMFLLALLLSSSVQSPEPVDGFVGRVFKKGGETMPYRLFIPEKPDKSKKYPLVIWLHGFGQDEQSFLTDIIGPLDIPTPRLAR